MKKGALRPTREEEEQTQSSDDPTRALSVFTTWRRSILSGLPSLRTHKIIITHKASCSQKLGSDCLLPLLCPPRQERPLEIKSQTIIHSVRYSPQSSSSPQTPRGSLEESRRQEENKFPSFIIIPSLHASERIKLLVLIRSRTEFPLCHDFLGSLSSAPKAKTYEPSRFFTSLCSSPSSSCSCFSSMAIVNSKNETTNS